MLKASNNYFDDRSKIKLLKISYFCNLKITKIAEKCWKIFSESVLESMVCAKDYKNYTKCKKRSNAYTSHILFSFFKNATPFKINAE